MAFKKQLAVNIVAQLWGESSAMLAQDRFERVFQRKEEPQNIPSFHISFEIPDGGLRAGPNKNNRLSRILIDSGLASSMSEVKRLLSQGAVEIDGTKETTDSFLDESTIGAIIRVGKHRFIRLAGVDQLPGLE